MTERDLAGRIACRASLAGVKIDDALASALAEYLKLLFRWNRQMNLTGLGEDDSGLDRLVVEPLVAVQQLPSGAPSVVDIGSGGGSPAVPLKLARPRLVLRMVESGTRKTAFLRHVVRQLGLRDVIVEGCRYEELLTRPELLGAADVITVRAVKIDGQALEGLQALLKVGGALFLFRRTGKDEVGDDVEDDVRLSLRISGSYQLVESLKSRLVLFEKT